jgi:D-alanyl-D-alanine carboxypeptidase
MIALAIRAGERNINNLTNMLFYARYPEMRGRRITANQVDLAQEWLEIRERIVRPVLATTPDETSIPRTPRSTQWLRDAWSDYECAEYLMVPLRILGTPPTPVNPITRRAFAALGEALRSTGYKARSVWNYNCRDIGGTGRRSLHAYGLAVDIDPHCNPQRLGARHPARLSSATTQEGRCRDVQAGLADATFTPAQISAVEAIQTVDGLPVFAWGGRWSRSPDAMHFQINLAPEEMRRQITPKTSELDSIEN